MYGVKRFVTIRLYGTFSNLKRISKMSTVPTLGKISADAMGIWFIFTRVFIVLFAKCSS